MTAKKIITVIGARPQFVKAAIVSRAFEVLDIQEIIIHTGQHYDPNMSKVFFDQLLMNKPDYNLNVGSTEPTKQLAMMLEKLSPILDKEKPDAVHVYGDTNSTVAACLAAVAKDIPLIHTEAGERIYRRYQVPEEVNRVIADSVASLNLTCTRRAENFLIREGISQSRVKFVGDPMYDLFCWGKSQLNSQANLNPEALGLKDFEYHLATIHRAQNTADKDVLLKILNALDKADMPVVLPIHPRVKNLLQKWNWKPQKSLKIIQSLGYFDFLNLLLKCKRCFTDSGGVTREAFFANKPCIVPMENSWWTDVVESGWMVTCDIDEGEILQNINSFSPRSKPPEGIFGDGNSSSAIANEIFKFLNTDLKDVSWHRLGNHNELPKSVVADCSIGNYKYITGELLKAGYNFIPFGEAEKQLESNKKFVLMRHDIDFNLKDALRIAEIEADMGIFATYFFMLRTEHYNLFSTEGTNIVKKILGLGHHFGLHFDMASYPENSIEKDLAIAVNKEALVLEDWFNEKVEIVSFHRPNQLILKGSSELSGARPHTYMDKFTDTIEYISDSRGLWSNGNPLQTKAFAQKKPLHILTHPIWWKESFISPYEVLQRFVEQKKIDIEKSVAENNTVYQRGLYSYLADK